MSMTEAVKLKEGGDRRGGGGSANPLASTFEKFGEYPRQWRSFLHDVRVEMRQVTWPTRHDVVVTTGVVIVTVTFFGIYFFGVDSAASWIVQHIIKLFAH
jgi:preprotein translocase subunit SecE